MMKYFYHIFSTNVLRATAVVVDPNLIKKASVVFAMAQHKTVKVIVNEGKLRSIKNLLYRRRKYEYYLRETRLA